jgi:predicted ATPase
VSTNSTRSAATPPLRSWSLRGFRSIGEATSFDLGTLNLLVGANSAGKSSVLHSLLLAAQTLSNPLADRPLVLNGHLVRVGLAEDVVHGATGGQLDFGFMLEAPGPERSEPVRVHFDSVSVDASLEVAGKARELQLAAVNLTTCAGGEETSVVVTRRTDAEADQAYRSAGLGSEAAAAAAARAGFAVDGTLPFQTVGASVRQFLPEHLGAVMNEYEQELATLRTPFRFGRPDDPTVRRYLQRELSAPVRDFVRQYLHDDVSPMAADLASSAERVTIGAFLEPFDEETRQRISEIVATTWFAQHHEELPFEGHFVFYGMPAEVDSSLNYIRTWFASSVHHLGPLRAAPQPLYELPEAAAGTSVGRSGEFTAAVLAAYAQHRVLSPDPRTGVSRNLPLRAAVDEWVQAMELLSSVRSEERGKLGYELHLAIEGVARDLDLTSVGVGVSQALPVVVLGLISHPGSLLLFEQPELHLHPDIQAALGDFFLALARSGRQLIVETHSEYLVNRLRRRSAEGAEDVEELVRLFFFERKGDKSAVTRGSIGRNGGMRQWPRGFFDTAAREIEAIALAKLPPRD